jgi:hypothetical protein
MPNATITLPICCGSMVRLVAKSPSDGRRREDDRQQAKYPAIRAGNPTWYLRISAQPERGIRLGQPFQYVACLGGRGSGGRGSAHEAESWMGLPRAFEPPMMTFTLPRWDVK